MRRRRTGHWLPDPVEKVMFSGGSASRDQRKERRYLAVDAGTSPTLRAWQVTDAVYGRCRQGDIVRVRYTPRLGRVKSVEVLRPAAVTADAPAVVSIGQEIVNEAAEFLRRAHGGGPTT